MSVDPVCVRIRRASRADVDSLVSIKQALRFAGQTSVSRGGFLLGADRDMYHALVTRGNVWMLEERARPIGFAVTYPDALVRTSELWHRRNSVRWEDGFAWPSAPGERIGYFDQLAVLVGRSARYWGAALALRALHELFVEQSHRWVFATTVTRPVRNEAALGYLRRFDARCVGTLDERHPNVRGTLTSAVHVLSAADWNECLARLPRRFLRYLDATTHVSNAGWLPTEAKLSSG